MPIDGAFLYNWRREIDLVAAETRVDKVNQPSRDEIIISLHKRGFSGKLIFTISDPRVHFTDQNYENPAQPPMFCMLMRKYFTGARYVGSYQDGLERAVRFDFDTYNELGDNITVSILIEIMGRNSNIILLEGNRIIDAIRRTSVESGKRIILPGAVYEPPESQNKISLITADVKSVAGFPTDCLACLMAFLLLWQERLPFMPPKAPMPKLSTILRICGLSECSKV